MVSASGNGAVKLKEKLVFGYPLEEESGRPISPFWKKLKNSREGLPRKNAMFSP
jgi:hypothetical protein